MHFANSRPNLNSTTFFIDNNELNLKRSMLVEPLCSKIPNYIEFDGQASLCSTASRY